MNHFSSLIRLIDQGLVTQVMLNDGSMILPFWPHDILGRGQREAGVVVVRGVFCADPDAPVDRVIPLCDIGGVFSRQPRQSFTADPGFLQRNPVPRGWTRLHAREPASSAGP